MRGRNPGHFGQSLSRRGKWVVGLVSAFVLAVFAGLGAWSAVGQGAYDRSANGCINVTVVSSTGGAVLHGCGGKARSMCQRAFRHTDQVSRQTQEQCRAAGINP
jgi:hypothetical protein